MGQHAYPVSMEIAGPTAMWTRPDTGDSPCSYPAPTYSAVRGIFEGILWGPDIQVLPRKVEICAPIQYHSYTCNYGGPLRKDVKDGNNYQMYATVLVDVCYRLYADVIPYTDKSKIDEKAKDWDKRTTAPGHAYQEIFQRRLRRGQSYASLALGWHEFTPSYYGPFREKTKVEINMPDIVVPSMLREVFSKGYKSEYHPIYDQDLVIRKGVLVYPRRGNAYDQ